MSEKKLIVPIITPILRKKDSKLWVSDEASGYEQLSLDDHFICTQTLVNLHNFFVNDCSHRAKNHKEEGKTNKKNKEDKDSKLQYIQDVIIADTAGEGQKLTFDFWKQLVDICFYVFARYNKIIAILFESKYESLYNESGALNHTFARCLDHIDDIYNGNDEKKQILITTTCADAVLRDHGLLSRLKEYSVYLYAGAPGANNIIEKEKYYDNESLLELVKEYSLKGVKVAGIKDYRKLPNKRKALKELRLSLKYLAETIDSDLGYVPPSIYEVSESNYFTSWLYTDGAIFSLANIEPYTFYRLTTEIGSRDVEGKYVRSGKYSESAKENIFDELRRKYLDEKKNWQYLIKNNFISKPFNIHYDEQEFAGAWDAYFKIYSEEPIKNTHVKNFNTSNWHQSVINTFFSDILSFQTTYYRHSPIAEYLFLPVAINIEDVSNDETWVYGMTSEILDHRDDHSTKKRDKGWFDTLTFQDASKLSHMFSTNFCSNYEIEKAILVDNMLFNDVSSDTSLLAEVEKYRLRLLSKDKNSKRVKTHWKKIKTANVVSTTEFEYRYQSEDGSEDIKVKLYVLVNSKLITKIPENVFKNLLRIALFTKRNKIATNVTEMHALHSAVAQVFARNFAHNIGSHVAIRSTNTGIKQRIHQLYKENYFEYSKNALRLQPPGKNKADKYLDKNNLDKNAFSFDDYQQRKYEAYEEWVDFMSGKLDMYEIHRNEYLAEYVLPPKNVMFYKDVIAPFYENTLLLDNIAASENVNYFNNRHNRLRINVVVSHKDKDDNSYRLIAEYPYLSHFDDFDEREDIAYPGNFPYLLEKKGTISHLKDALNNKIIKGADLEVCLPNEHSFYSILENVIRNSAKHNKAKLADTGKDLDITILISEDDDPDYYEVLIYDNVSQVQGSKIAGFKNNLKSQLIDENSNLNKRSLGLADMKINAHLLRSNKDIDKDNISESLDILVGSCGLDEDLPQFVEHDKDKHANTDTFRFAYKLALAKPKKIIWIGVELSEKDKEYFNSIGVYTYRDLKQYENNKNESIASFQFAILEPEIAQQIENNVKDDSLIHHTIEEVELEWDEFLISLPFRVLLNTPKSNAQQNETLKKLIDVRRIQPVQFPIEIPGNKIDADFEILNSCWRNWLQRWLTNDPGGIGKRKASLYIHLEDEGRVKAWNIAEINNIIDKEQLRVVVFHNELPGDKDVQPVNEEEYYDVIYDHHGNGVAKLFEYRNNRKYEINSSSYYTFDKGSEDFILLTNPPESVLKQTLLVYEAVEAGLYNMIILDERIAECSSYSDASINKLNNFLSGTQRRQGRKRALDELLNWGSTYLTSSFNEKPLLYDINENFRISIDGNVSDASLLSISSPEFLNIERELFFDCLVIHRTYLNEVFEEISNQHDLTDQEVILYRKKLMNMLYRKFPNIIVISGGGLPHSFQFKFKFRPLSSISKHFSKYISKISLIKHI